MCWTWLSVEDGLPCP